MTSAVSASLRNAAQTGLGLQVQRQAALVAVQVLEIRTGAWTAELRGVDRCFDLDDIGAPVGKLPHAGRAGSDPRKVKTREVPFSASLAAAFAI